MTSRPVETIELFDFEAQPSAGLARWMVDESVSLGFSHTNKVVGVSADLAGLHFSTADYDRVTVLASGPNDSLWIAADHELWMLANAVPAGSRSPTGADRQYVPRTGRLLGRVRPADLGFLSDETPVFCSVTLSCVGVPHRSLSMTPVWAPTWISDILPETRCRLTGLCTRDGELAAVTSASMSDAPDGWRSDMVNGGVVVDPSTDEILLDRIGLPHSPRWHAGRLWVLSAATGEFGFVENHRYEVVTRLDGFARGMSLFGRWAVVGLSGSRWDELVADLPLGDRLKRRGERPVSGLAVIDIESGRVEHQLVLDGTAREVSDVVVHHSSIAVEYESPAGRVAQNTVTIPTGFGD